MGGASASPPCTMTRAGDPGSCSGAILPVTGCLKSRSFHVFQEQAGLSWDLLIVSLDQVLCWTWTGRRGGETDCQRRREGETEREKGDRSRDTERRKRDRVKDKETGRRRKRQRLRHRHRDGQRRRRGDTEGSDSAGLGPVESRSQGQLVLRPGKPVLGGPP